VQLVPRPLRPAVFLDRDGVLNAVELSAGRPLPPASVERFSLLPRVPEACRLLRIAGYFLVVVTNQPDLARGQQTAETIDELHAALARAVQLDDIRVCPHDDADNCPCRKPKPGLLLSAASEHRLDLGRSYMVGDRWRDVEAGRRAGCRTVLLYSDYDERQAAAPDKVVNTLLDAAQWILSLSASREGGGND
jgi:D-glycero-D-manno-heptose 1,7-bisphosphate phosphatase